MTPANLRKDPSLLSPLPPLCVLAQLAELPEIAKSVLANREDHAESYLPYSAAYVRHPIYQLLPVKTLKSSQSESGARVRALRARVASLRARKGPRMNTVKRTYSSERDEKLLLPSF